MPDQAPLPDFELAAAGNQRFRLSAFKGHPVVLYSFVIDRRGRIAKEWRGVKVPGHAQVFSTS